MRQSRLHMMLAVSDVCAAAHCKKNNISQLICTDLMKSSARSALQNSTRLSRENAKLDQLSHFVQLAMGELQKKKKETRLRKSLKWLITHNLKSPTRQAFWGKCFSWGGWGRGGGRAASTGETAPRSDSRHRPWSAHPHAGRATGTVLESASMRTLLDRMFGYWTFK